MLVLVMGLPRVQDWVFCLPIRVGMVWVRQVRKKPCDNYVAMVVVIRLLAYGLAYPFHVLKRYKEPLNLFGPTLLFSLGI